MIMFPYEIYQFYQSQFYQSATVADPDVQIRGGGEGGGSHPDSEISGGDVSKKIFFGPSWPHFGLKIRGGPGPLRAPPLNPPLWYLLTL